MIYEPTILRNHITPRKRRSGLWGGDIESIFDNFLSELSPRLVDKASSKQEFVPAINVEENDKSICVSAELPGIDEKDVEISLENGVLTIAGEKHLEKKEKDKGGYTYYESSHGTFQRQLTLNTEVDEDKVEATFKNGVLRVELPKKEEEKLKKKKIQVKSSS